MSNWPDWIDVNERKPAHGQHVLVCDRRGNVFPFPRGTPGDDGEGRVRMGDAIFVSGFETWNNMALDERLKWGNDPQEYIECGNCWDLWRGQGPCGFYDVTQWPSFRCHTWIEENGVSLPASKDDLIKLMAAFDAETSNGSRFTDPAKVLREAEAFCEDADAVDEEDRIHEEHMCLALWDELRNLRREVSRISKEQNAQYIENVWLKDANADHLLKIEELKEALSPFALFSSALA